MSHRDRALLATWQQPSACTVGLTAKHAQTPRTRHQAAWPRRFWQPTRAAAAAVAADSAPRRQQPEPCGHPTSKCLQCLHKSAVWGRAHQAPKFGESSPGSSVTGELTRLQSVSEESSPGSSVRGELTRLHCQGVGVCAPKEALNGFELGLLHHLLCCMLLLLHSGCVSILQRMGEALKLLPSPGGRAYRGAPTCCAACRVTGPALHEQQQAAPLQPAAARNQATESGTGACLWELQIAGQIHHQGRPAQAASAPLAAGPAASTTSPKHTALQNHCVQLRTALTQSFNLKDFFLHVWAWSSLWWQRAGGLVQYKAGGLPPAAAAAAGAPP